MGKTIDFFKKIRDTKGIFHAKMGTIKDKNGMDVTEAEDIKKRWQKYTEELYKKVLYDLDNCDGMISHLEPDILECEIKWALGSITMNKASGGDGIPAQLFQVLEDDAVKVLHSIYQQIWTTQQWPQDWKRLVFIPIPKKGKANECSNYHTVALILHARQVILKILQVRLQQDMHQELPDVQTGLEKAEELEVILPTSVGSSKKQETFRKTSTSALLTMPKPLTVWITTNWKILKEITKNCGKFLKRLKQQNTLPAS